MLKLILATALGVVLLQSAAQAACSLEATMTKLSDISEVLMPKMQTKAEQASQIMSEMGEATGTGAVTEQTCTKLDALMVRAKKL